MIWSFTIEPGPCANDCDIIRHIKKIMVDTRHFKGNYPDRCSLEGCFCSDDERVRKGKVHWMLLMDEQKLSAHSEHFFEKVRSAYLERAARFPERFVVLDGSSDEDAVWKGVRSAVEGQPRGELSKTSASSPSSTRT